MSVHVLDNLQYAKPVVGPWRVYIFDRDGYHKGGKYFNRGPLPTDPVERRYWITREAAKDDVIRSLRQGLEVRITDGGDMLVFHAKGSKLIYPPEADMFWNAVGV